MIGGAVAQFMDASQLQNLRRTGVSGRDGRYSHVHRDAGGAAGCLTGHAVAGAVAIEACAVIRPCGPARAWRGRR